MRRIILSAALLALLWSPLRSPCQMVTVTAQNLQTGGQNSAAVPVNGTIYFTPATPYRGPGGGQTTNAPSWAIVTDGAFTIQLPDVTLTQPPNLCFSVSISTKTGGSLGPGYSCVQPHGTPTGSSDWCQIVNGAPLCDFDNYAPVLTTNFPALPPAPDMLSMWNSMVSQNVSSGGATSSTTLTDAATVTWNATSTTLNAANLPLYTPAGPPDNCGNTGQPSCTAQPDGLSSRTVNVSGMVAGARYLLAIQSLGSAAGQQTVDFGAMCTWQWTVGNVPMSGTSLVIPSWVNWSYLVAWSYDGTNCAATVVD